MQTETKLHQVVLGMVTGKIHTDIYIMDPYPRAKFHARIPARRSERAESHAQNRYPRVSCARGHARVPAAPSLREHGAYDGSIARARRRGSDA